MQARRVSAVPFLAVLFAVAHDEAIVRCLRERRGGKTRAFNTKTGVFNIKTRANDNRCPFYGYCLSFGSGLKKTPLRNPERGLCDALLVEDITKSQLQRPCSRSAAGVIKSRSVIFPTGFIHGYNGFICSCIVSFIF